MIVYPAEIDSGIESVMKSKASIEYTCLIIYNDEIFKNNENLLTIASRKLDRIDLYPIDSILVSVGWNNNDDIFDKGEVWAARNSPEDKPFNFMHNQLDIIGHTISTTPVNEHFSLLDDNISFAALPDKFHILNRDVIYKFWEDKSRAEKISELIREIEAGKWAVSMECLFADFDYGIIHPNGESRVIARNAETSVLTKYLRVYGGTGLYNNFKIGRVLRQITFSGKGLVDHPANPDSKIILDFKSISANLGYMNLSTNSNKETCMNELELLKAENEKLKKEVAEVTNAKVAALEGKVEALAKTITNHENTIASLNKNLEDYKTLAKDKEDEKKKFEEEKATLKAELDSEKKTVDEYKKAEANAKVTKARREKLVGKVDTAVAEKLVDSFMEMSDAKFDEFVNTLSDLVVAKKEEDEKVMKDTCAEDVVTTVAEKSSANLGVPMTEDQTVLANAVAEWFKNSVRNGR